MVGVSFEKGVVEIKVRRGDAIEDGDGVVDNGE